VAQDRESALLIDGHTLVTGALIRASMILPDPKLSGRVAAIGSVRCIAKVGSVGAFIVSDGNLWKH
jgi:hypothetical protein